MGERSCTTAYPFKAVTPTLPAEHPVQPCAATGEGLCFDVVHVTS